MSSDDTPPRTGLIDLHHHVFPPTYKKAALSASVGFRTPPGHLPWTPELSLHAMDAMGVQLTVLSVPAGYPHARGPDALKATRDANALMHGLGAQHAGRFAFWGCLGDWRDIDAALGLIPYVMDELKAVGIAIASTYGHGDDAKSVGDDMFDPIWEELNRRNAIIFLHGSQMPAATPMPHSLLGLPITEVPHETFKAISHLVVSGKTRRFSSVAFLLAHLGGSTLALAPRAAALSRYMGAALSEAEILEEFRKCWWDTALSADESTLGAVEASGVGERVVWGSDFPAVPLETIAWFDANLEKFYEADQTKLRGVFRENALRLFQSRGIDILKTHAI
ncbi:amidohydrolase 2 [Artomyces pyxidatus]|uniref:Amidohydrolase 2 n=1 Tax=Artomyces pyxidatus TaxID=48021 RepID=A0ACB8TJR8_9AGAM|nr:amidohydrolase 2 [Artomyces pyxidatus]